jgi:hypothetical protein
MTDTIDVAQIVAEVGRGDTEPGVQIAQIVAEVGRGDTEPGIQAAQVVVEVAYRVPKDEVGATLHTPFVV